MFRLVKIGLSLAFLLAAFLGGYFYADFKKGETEKVFRVSREKNPNQENTSQEVFDPTRKQEITLRLELLKDYLNFIFLPKEETGNPEEYASRMEQKVSLIGDGELLDKYYSTGEKENKDQKILDFLNFSLKKLQEALKTE